MDCVININMDNAAFDEENAGPELARILKKTAFDLGRLQYGDEEELTLRDINGNTIGTAIIVSRAV